MSIMSRREYENTRRKLALLEEQFEKSKARPVENATTRELSLRSLQRMINQLKEEIAKYQAHAAAPGS